VHFPSPLRGAAAGTAGHQLAAVGKFLASGITSTAGETVLALRPLRGLGGLAAGLNRGQICGQSWACAQAIDFSSGTADEVSAEMAYVANWPLCQPRRNCRKNNAWRHGPRRAFGGPCGGRPSRGDDIAGTRSDRANRHAGIASNRPGTRNKGGTNSDSDARPPGRASLPIQTFETCRRISIVRSGRGLAKLLRCSRRIFQKSLNGVALNCVWHVVCWIDRWPSQS
jgi:hypothetical protein